MKWADILVRSPTSMQNPQTWQSWPALASSSQQATTRGPANRELSGQGQLGQPYMTLASPGTSSGFLKTVRRLTESQTKSLLQVWQFGVITDSQPPVA